MTSQLTSRASPAAAGRTLRLLLLPKHSFLWGKQYKSYSLRKPLSCVVETRLCEERLCSNISLSETTLAMILDITWTTCCVMTASYVHSNMSHMASVGT